MITNGGLSRRTPGQRETAAERRVKAFELRKGGASYRQIARAIGCGERTAWRDVMGRLQELNRLEEPARGAVLRLELERLDALFVVHFGRALTGDDRAARTVLACMERRAKLLGLDVTRVELTGPEGGPMRYVAEWPEAPALEVLAVEDGGATSHSA